VALTRARSRLYLPFFGGDAAPGAGYALRPSAAYYRVQEALGGLVGTGAQRAPARGSSCATSSLALVICRPPTSARQTLLASSWLVDGARGAAPPLPPAPLDAQLFVDLRRRHRGPQATSYSRLAGRRARTLTEGAPNEEPKADVHDAPSLSGPIAATREAAQAGEGGKLQRAAAPTAGRRRHGHLPARGARARGPALPGRRERPRRGADAGAARRRAARAVGGVCRAQRRERRARGRGRAGALSCRSNAAAHARRGRAAARERHARGS
jgi:hypothetical protein